MCKNMSLVPQGFGLMVLDCFLDSVGEGEGGMIWENGIETCIISYMKQSPVQVRCTILDARGWCTGTTQRDGMGREEGGGFRMGNTCIPVADHFDIWQN